MIVSDRLARPGVLDVLVDATLIVSSDLRVIAANAAARSLLLDGGADPTGTELLDCVVPDDAPRLLDALGAGREATPAFMCGCRRRWASRSTPSFGSRH